LFRLKADRVTDGLWDTVAGLVERVGGGQADRRHSFSRVHVRYALVFRKGCMDKDRSGVVAKVFRLVRPPLDEKAEVEAGGDPIFVEIQGCMASGRIPATAFGSCERGVQRIHPTGIGYAKPGVAVGQAFGAHQA